MPDQSYASDADPYADVIKLASLAVPVVTYAIKDRDADVYAEKVKLTQWESDIIIRTPLGRLQVRAVIRNPVNVTKTCTCRQHEVAAVRCRHRCRAHGRAG
jgi:hypothetical protein